MALKGNYDYEIKIGDKEYAGHIAIIDGLVPAGNTNFPLMSANSIWIPARWDRFSVETQPENSIRVDKRIQQLEDDKVNRVGGDILNGSYAIMGDVIIGSKNEEGQSSSWAEFYAPLAIIDKYLKVSDIFCVQKTEAGSESYFDIITTFKKDVIIGDSSVKASLTVNGDLIVNGTTITENHKTLDIQDNILVLNKSEEGLNGINDTGFVLCSANQDTYFGIILDTSDQTVRLGVGDLSQNNAEGSDTYGNKFEFKEGEGLPFALRAESSQLTDQHLLIWDSASKSIHDSTKTVQNVIDDAQTQVKGSDSSSTFNELRESVHEEIAALYYNKEEQNNNRLESTRFYVKRKSFSAEDINNGQAIDLRVNTEHVFDDAVQKIIINSFMIPANIEINRAIFTPAQHYSLIVKSAETLELIFAEGIDIYWSTMEPQIMPNTYYKFDFVRSGDGAILGSWTIFTKGE